jgi:hypothetical protein
MTFSLLRFRQVGNSIIDQTISIYCLSGKIVRAAGSSKKAAAIAHRTATHSASTRA